MVSDALCEAEASLESPRIEIIEKQSAYAAGLPSVLQVEILITPLLESADRRHRRKAGMRAWLHDASVLRPLRTHNRA